MKLEIMSEKESDESYDDLYAHKPRIEDDINETLIDCDPRLGTCTQEEYQKAADENRLWTIVACDDEGQLYALKGNHVVNAMSHHICEIPYAGDE